MPERERDTESPGRTLWLAVILQAKEDIADEPMGSIAYDEAISFFLGTAGWADSRAAIAILLDMDPDALMRLGRGWIRARRVLDGLTAEAPPAPPSRPLPPVILAVIPDLRAPPMVCPRPPDTPRGLQGRLRHVFNPFNPLIKKRPPVSS